MDEEVKLKVSRLVELLETFAAGLPTNALDEFDRIDVSYQHLGEESSVVFRRVVEFIDDWLDASNHNWMYHDPMQREDWSVAAKQIAKSLSSEFKLDFPVKYIRPR